MRFSKQALIDTLDEGSAWDPNNNPLTEKVAVIDYDHSRWSSHHELIFKCIADGKFYGVDFSKGLTEQQSEYPFDYEPDEIECFEVVKVEVMTYEWHKLPVNKYVIAHDASPAPDM
jgi:hypothetical protein